MSRFIQINILWYGERRLMLSVDRRDTVAMLKRKCRDKMGCVRVCGCGIDYCTRVDYMRASRYGEVLEDDKSMEDCDICENDTVTMTEHIRGGGCPRDGPMTVRRPEGGTFTVTVVIDERIRDIRERIESQQGYGMRTHELLILGRAMADEKCVVYAMIDDNIHHSLDINIICTAPHQRVTVRVIPNNVSRSILIGCSMRVSDMKRVIFEETGLREDIQQLSMNGAILNDNNRVPSSLLERGTARKTIVCRLMIADEVNIAVGGTDNQRQCIII